MAKSPTTAGEPGSHQSAANGPGRELKKQLAGDKVLVGGILVGTFRPMVVKLYAHAGFDFIFLEYEHTFVDPSHLVDSVLCARDNGLPVIAKTPQLERAAVAKLIDCGVVGIQLPRTESRDQVEMLLGYMKFPPRGTRAVMPGSGNSSYDMPDNWETWMRDQDEESLLVVHIETRAGYENAAEIVSTPGVDMVYVGPGDFSIAMGHPGNYDHDAVVGPMREILALCREHNVPFGTTASNIEAAKVWVESGARFFETVDEMSLIYEGAAKTVCDYRKITK